MSLSLDQGTTPSNLEAKTYGRWHDGNKVHLGAYEISLEDFLALTMYVLTNTDLVAGDPRLAFMSALANLQQVPGHQPGNTRLG